MFLPYLLAPLFALRQETAGPSGLLKIGVYRTGVFPDESIPALVRRAVSPPYRIGTVYIVESGSTTKIFVEPVPFESIAGREVSWSWHVNFVGEYGHITGVGGGGG